MKKLFYLSAALLCAVTVTAQTVSKSGHSSKSYSSGSSGSTSGGSKNSTSNARSSYSYSSKASNGATSASSASTSTKFEKSGTYANGWSENIRDHKNYYQSPVTNYKPTMDVNLIRQYNLTMATLRSEKDKLNVITVVKQSKDDFSETISGIYKVGREELKPLNHEDLGKIEPTPNTGENGSTNYILPTNNDTVPFGAEEIEIAKKVHTNPNYVARNIAGCSDAEFTNIVYWRGILKNYEVYDISQLNECHKEFPKEIVVEVTCIEFQNSSDERKAHIINNPNFYDITGLKSCPAYLDFINEN